MIIYASRNSGYKLDKFVGKDLWVLARVTSYVGLGESWNSIYLVRIISAGDTYYDFNKIHDCTSNHRDGTWHCNITQKQNALNNIYRTSKENIQIIEPEEVYTTDELFRVVSNI